MSDAIHAVRPLAAADEPYVADYAALLWRYRRSVIALVAIALLSAVVTSLLVPKMYQSTTILLPPKEEATGGLLAGLVASGVTGGQLALPGVGGTANRDMILSILKSRTVAEAIVKRFDLQERYGAKILLEAVKQLQEKRSEIALTKENAISIAVEDPDPEIAAGIANFYVAELQKLVVGFGVGEASQQRKFIASQLAKTKVTLETSEEALRRFQEKNRAVVLQEQMRGAIDAAARLKAEIVATEVQLTVLQNFATEANPDVVALRRRLNEMRRHLAEMQYGDDGRSSSNGVAAARTNPPDFYVPFAKVPEVGLDLIRLTRDVKVQETLLTLLAAQLEQVKISEAKDLPSIQVLDPAVVAERPYKPRLFQNAGLAAAVALFVGTCLAFFLNYLHRTQARVQAA